MVVEQILKDWLAERTAAIDLSVSARTVKAIATEIEAHYNDVVARSRAEAMERAQQLAEKEASLSKAQDVISRLETQLAQMRDRSDRLLAGRDRVIEEKDEALLTHMQTVAKLEAQFTAAREAIEGRLEKVEAKLAQTEQERSQCEKRRVGLEKELEEKDGLLESYRQKFGVIIQAVQ